MVQDVYGDKEAFFIKNAKYYWLRRLESNESKIDLNSNLLSVIIVKRKAHRSAIEF